MKALVSLAPLALALSASGCDLEPDVGAPIAARCSSADTDPDSDIDFARDILPIMVREQAGCVPCHRGIENGVSVMKTSGLDLSSYETLRQGGLNSGTDIVIAGDPCNSVLYLKVSAGPPFGSRMPYDGPPFLSDLELRLIHDWIAEGAKEQP